MKRRLRLLKVGWHAAWGLGCVESMFLLFDE